LLPPDLIFEGYNAQNSNLAGTPPQTSLGELTALPQTPSWVLGVLPLRGGKGRDERGGKGKEGKGGEGQDGTGRQGRGQREGSEGRGRERSPPPPQFTFLAKPLRNGRSNLKIATTCLYWYPWNAWQQSRTSVPICNRSQLLVLDKSTVAEIEHFEGVPKFDALVWRTP